MVSAAGRLYAESGGRQYERAQATPVQPRPALGEVSLGSPWPNPASGRATVSFGLTTPSAIRLSVHDALGREVAVLAVGAFGAGHHPVPFEASGLSSGVYTLRLQAGTEVRTSRLVLAR